MILANKRAIITGGSGSIGGAIGRAFVREGAEILLVARRLRELQKTREAFLTKAGSVFIHAADVTKTRDVATVLKKTRELWRGNLDILVNVAGIYGPKGFLEDIEPREWMEAVRINLLGTMFMTRAVLPFMKKRRSGSIINLSGGGEGPFPMFSSYAASKGGVVRFTESVAEEVAPWGIRVNAIAPGGVNSKLLDEVLSAGPKKVGYDFFTRAKKQKEEGGIPPEKAAELVVFLSSDQSSGLSGRILSAVWDQWKGIPKHLKEIMDSDIYTYRRIKPRDRGYGWR